MTKRYQAQHDNTAVLLKAPRCHSERSEAQSKNLPSGFILWKMLRQAQHDNTAVLLQMGGCFASPSAVLVGWFGMAQGKVPPHKKRQQQNAAAIKRCYPIHPCHHLFASVFLAYVVWERQHGLAALPLAECAMLGKTCLRMRFRKQRLLCTAQRSPFPRRATSYFGFGPMPKAHFN